MNASGTALKWGAPLGYSSSSLTHAELGAVYAASQLKERDAKPQYRSKCLACPFTETIATRRDEAMRTETLVL